ncbi:MAG: ImmA/IrrE family metallo-endopeptidase [Anaerosomatales bacterium]|nr:ImmA/IrrE family metallo-endopeptidase [Anaerosomatales bacterium]
MALRADAYYRQLAERAVRESGIEEPPVPVAAVAEKMGVPIFRAAFPVWFTGMLVHEDGMPLIVLNAAKDKTIQDTAIAHLLGHILILLDDASERYPKGDTEGHRAADVVAEELILPGFMVIDQAAKWFNDYRYLARLFGVSEKRMLEKMQALGLIKLKGILWDY